MLIVGTLMTLALTGWLLAALLRSDPGEGGGEAARVYEDQLAEIDRDLARGVLADDQAAAARAEVERRMLTALRRGGEDGAQVSRKGRLAAAVGLALVPLAAFLLYARLGSPALPDRPLGARAPGEAVAWIRRGDQLGASGQPGDAAAAYLEAVRLTDGTDPFALGAYGEALVAAAGGEVGAEARRAFEGVLAINADDPRAVAYLAIGKAQDGDVERARADLDRLLAGAPAGAPWRARVVALRDSL